MEKMVRKHNGASVLEQDQTKQTTQWFPDTLFVHFLVEFFEHFEKVDVRLGQTEHIQRIACHSIPFSQVAMTERFGFGTKMCGT